MKRFVIGDIHGGYKALLQCLDRSKFDKNNDLLISLGDVTDGWNQTPECIDELLSIPNLIYIIGNHDMWLWRWFQFGDDPYIWLSQGGSMSKQAYIDRAMSKIRDHEKLFINGHYYYVLDNKLFVHGGYDWHLPIHETTNADKMWDRHLYETACMWEATGKNNPDKDNLIIKEYDEVYIGHTTTTYSMNWRIGPSFVPLRVSNVWNLDQGAGWEGKLSIMNIDTKEYWQSDVVAELYPEEKGRR